MTMAQAADYSDEQLRAAWTACRRPAWPRTFEEAMADTVYAALVRHRAWRAAHPATPAIVRRPAPTARPPLLQMPAGWVDHKRAAAGDRDDD